MSATAVKALAEVSRRADNSALLAGLADFGIDPLTIVADLEAERAGR